MLRLVILRLLAGLGVLGPLHGLAALPDPAQWEKEIRAFEESARTNPPPHGAVLFLGSSSIRLWTNLASYFPQCTTVQRGFGGCYVPDLTHYLDRVAVPIQPAKIVIYGGENDLAKGRTPGELSADFRTLYLRIQARLPRAKVYFLSLKPSHKRWYLSPQMREANARLRQFCFWTRRARFIDLWDRMLGADGQPDRSLYLPDQHHVNEQGYRRWAPQIRSALGCT